MIQPHVKLLHILEAPTIKKRKSLMLKFKDDKLLGQLIELLTSPEYKHNYSIYGIPLEQEATKPTESTFIKFRSLIHRGEDVTEYLSTLDSATRFVYAHIANRTDLEVPFKFIADTFKLFNRFNYNEHYIDYGFPTLPCLIQVLPKDRQMINIKVDNISTATYLDGRYYKDISTEILEQIKRLYLKGDFTGYIEDDVYYITNYYPKGDYTFSRRILAVESAIERIREDIEVVKVYNSNHKLQNIEVVKAFTLTHEKYLKHFLVEDHEVICKQDTLPVFGKSHNMISLDCNRFIELFKIKEDSA
jgi:uncharacterized protein YbaR (Trm112 family)